MFPSTSFEISPLHDHSHIWVWLDEFKHDTAPAEVTEGLDQDPSLTNNNISALR